jgi:hypothetical protein
MEVRRIRTYEESLSEVETLCDKLGMPIDEKIKPLVAALRMYGVKTTMSCEGHSDWGKLYPWVRFDPADVDLVGSIALRGSDSDEWVLMRSTASSFDLVPWDVKRPLGELHEMALKLAENIRLRDE